MSSGTPPQSPRPGPPRRSARARERALQSDQPDADLGCVTTTLVAPPEVPWVRLVDDVLRDPTRLELVFRPIVSLQDAVVVGYEALSRFAGPPALTPDRWFAAADERGRGAELEALVVERCLALRSTLPSNCFLTVNVSPHLLTDSVLGELLLGAGDLRPLVLCRRARSASGSTPTAPPTALVLPLHRTGDAPAAHRTAPVSLRVPASTGLAELARRIVTRAEACRFDPVVVVDELGRATGVVRVERVLLRLAELQAAGGGRRSASA